MQQPLVCENCGIVIRWQPTIVGERVYCCAGCAQGGPCECDYENLPQPDDMRAMMLHPARRQQYPDHEAQE